MSTPLIGVTMTRSTSKYGYPILTITEAYTQALIRSGACPVMIPLGLSETVLQDLFPVLDGILFTGGGDVHPDQYGSQMHPLVGEVDRDRDRIEIFLLHECMRRQMPFLGICRGLQVINVALGGSLYEDVLEQKPAGMRHSYFPEFPRDYLAHSVEIEPGSRLFEILGESAPKVNSLHHQGIKDLAPGLSASAFAPDGLVEAFELPAYRFGLGVQWHPEWLPQEASMDVLLRKFIQVAGE